jgi:hypothetical protein
MRGYWPLFFRPLIEEPPMKHFPRPTGELTGDTKPLPDRGTATGIHGDTYGADTSQNATNRIVGIRGATRSDSEIARLVGLTDRDESGLS